jgi:hypothetical protein
MPTKLTCRHLQAKRSGLADRWTHWYTPGMGVNLWGENPLYVDYANKSFDLISITTNRRQGRHCEVVSKGLERRGRRAEGESD